MSAAAIVQVCGVSKQYRLGEVSTGTLAHDLNRWWHRVRGRPDPYVKVTQANVRDQGADRSGYVWALRGVDFEVRRGDVLGIIGRNGAGKSTLLKIMSRVTAPTEGEIRIKGKIASLLEVGTGFHPELTGRENIYLNGAILGMPRAEVARKLDEIVDFSGCARYIDTPVKRYSSGMTVRLGFAVAAHLEPDILIVDEVLAVGDAEFQQKCIGKMQDVASQGRTVFFVSHNMAAVERLCSRALILDAGRVAMDGTPAECIARYLDDAQSSARAAYKDQSNGEVLLNAFELICGGKAAAEVFLDGGELAFDISLESRRDLRHFAVHIGLYTHWGVLVCLCRSDAAADMPLSAGRHRLRCSLGSIPLAAGSYYCHIALLEKSQPLGSGLRQLSFRVVSGSEHYSSIRHPPPVLAPALRWERCAPPGAVNP